MAFHPALHIEDICSSIVDFLCDSSADLKSCAILSRAFTLPAQRYIFREINLHAPVSDTLISACSRLCAVLAASPHLIPLIREMRIRLEREILTRLAGITFSRVENLFFCAAEDTLHSEDITSLAASLLAGPSVRRLKLMSITFEDMASLRVLFGRRMTLDLLQLDNISVHRPPSPPGKDGDTSQRCITLNALEIRADPNFPEPTWILHPLCPLDFSVLTRIAVFQRTSETIRQLIYLARDSLHTLTIDGRLMTTDFRLADIPELQTVRIHGAFNSAQLPTAILSSAGANNIITDIYVTIHMVGTLDDTSLLHLDATLATHPMPALRAVDILISRISFPWGADDETAQFLSQMAHLGSSFPNLDARGCLRLSSIDGAAPFLPS
ncbi:hypothetical protein DFH07DRAFT_958395 [Mycena maculata]|uniref:Uncharacterized protein n=1 Tax=Mycena maculata TaxID=230809 RepID=A0AAD7NED5_9AGAR|nr:hypothetical protein DFH07DRAFT_958395 [Mycena maculata]